VFGTGSILDQFAALAALMATGIAVGGFLGLVAPALRGDGDKEARRATAIGGLYGLGATLSLGVLSAFVAIFPL